jgi:hypothetical protein
MTSATRSRSLLHSSECEGPRILFSPYTFALIKRYEQVERGWCWSLATSHRASEPSGSRGRVKI